jgi:probable HAF family extracellular repeat protein
MSPRSFAPSAAVAALLATGLLACSDDPLAPTPPASGASSPAAAVTAAATYSIKDLGTLGGTSAMANSINDQGGIVGWSERADGRVHGFLYRAGKMQDLGALAGGRSEALAINNSDVIVGSSTAASGASRAVRWQNGRVTNLGTLGGRNSAATAINDLGVIAGWSETAAGKTHAFVYRDGVMQDLGTLGGDWSVASGINRAGKIVGSSSTASGVDHPFTWKDGVMKDLGTHGHIEGAAAVDINTGGQIAVVLGPLPDAQGEELDGSFAFIFYQGGWTSLGAAEPTIELLAINNAGTVVGWGEDLRDETFRQRAWVSTPGHLDLLPALTPDGVDEVHANDINSFGTIVGSSTEVNGNYTGVDHAVLWRRQ